MTHPPPRHPWTVAIHRTATDNTPIGTGVVIGERGVLTAGHVVTEGHGWPGGLWVSFPMEDRVPWGERRRVERCVPDEPLPVADIALLELEEPVPTLVTPARLRYPNAQDLWSQRWWAFGFPDQSDAGEEARGTLGAGLGFGRVRLNTDRPHRIVKGFSGGPLWSPEYDAVVGIVLSANDDGDGHALTLSFADLQLPQLKIQITAVWSVEAADETAHAAWGWSLRDDRERGRHWSPRSRGVMVESQPGYHFRGRTRALAEVTQWLDRTTPDACLLVVTGSPGVGKSAVLGRVVTSADPQIRDQLPPDDVAVRAPVGSIGCAVHVKGKTALEVAVEIARATSAAMPVRPEDLVPALRDRLAERRSRFNLVVDALDEASDPGQTRTIIGAILIPLVRTCADLGAQVIVGTRRMDDEGSLLALLADSARVIDLDEPAYFEDADLVRYAQSTLQLVGAERPGNPYADPAVAAAVAQRIGALARGNFLVAGLVARRHGMTDTTAVDPAALSFTATVDATLETYIGSLPSVGRSSARLALTVLAFAEAPGLTRELWRDGITALGGESTVDDLRLFAGTSAANFLIESGSEAGSPSYRLFHQALNDALLGRREAERTRAEDERALVDAWLRQVATTGWDAAPEYLRRSLAGHAVRCDRIDELLADDAFVLRADLRRLMVAAGHSRTDAGQARARVLLRTSRADGAGPAERAAMFSVTEAVDRLDARIALPADAPYVAAWANTPPGLEQMVLEGHSEAVLGVCGVPVGDRELIASAGEDGSVRLWDPRTGETERVLEGHQDRVRGVCAVRTPHGPLLASAGDDARIVVWDPTTGERLRTLLGHADWIRAVCAVEVDGAVRLASASDDRTVRLWDPLTGDLTNVLSGLIGWATSLCPVPLPGWSLLASAGYDGSVMVWDPRTGHRVHTLTGHTAWVSGLTAVEVAGEVLLASGGYDGTVRLWDPRTGVARQRWEDSQRPVTGLCRVRRDGQDLLVSSSEDGGVRLRDPADGQVVRTLDGHSGWATGVCAVRVNSHERVASASEDGTVRLWDPATGHESRVRDGGRTGPIARICAIAAGDVELVASTTQDGAARLWDPATGVAGLVLSGHFGPLADVCSATVDGQALLVTAGQDHRIRLWDPESGTVVRTLDNHGDAAAAVCAVPTPGRDRLASVGDDQSVRLWNLATGALERELYGHSEWVRGVSAIPHASGPLIASASHDGTVRLWDAGSGQCVRILTGHHGAVLAVCALRLHNGHMLASAGADRLVRLWEPESGRPIYTLDGHTAEVTAVAPVTLRDRPLLASASLDRTVRLWDPSTGALVQTIPVHHPALSCRYVSGRLVVGLDKGLVALTLRNLRRRTA